MEPLILALPPASLPVDSSSTLAPWLGLLASYLLGAVPFGFCLAKILRGVDLREVGSGNIGATNAMRVLGKPLGLFAFALDFAKGWVPVAWLAPALAGTSLPGETTWWPVAYGAAAVLGHVFPVYLRFRGGKAVATGAGALVGLDPLTFLIAGATWPFVLLTSRMVSLASLIMGVAFPLVALWRRSEGAVDLPTVVLAAGLALLIVVRHRANVSRILAGTESRIGSKRSASPPASSESA